MFLLNYEILEEREDFFLVLKVATSPPRTAAGAYSLNAAQRDGSETKTPHREGAAGRGIRHRSRMKRTKIPKTNCVSGDLSRIRLV